jgi:hypothetical protein
VLTDDLFHDRGQFLQPRGLIPAIVGIRRGGVEPGLVAHDAAASNFKSMAWIEFVHALQDRAMRFEHISEFQVLGERGRIDLRIEIGQRAERLDFGSEGDALGPRQVVQGFHAHCIPRQVQRGVRRIPQRQGEHAGKAREACRAPFDVAAQNHFGVALRAECMAATLQLVA